MDEKSVRAIRSLASPSEEAVGSAMRKNAAATPVEEPQPCPSSDGTGCKDVAVQGESRVAMCSCLLQAQARHFLVASEIQERYARCEFSNYETGGSDGLAAAKIKIETWATQYPLDRTGLLLVGPSGVGKT